MLSRGRNRGKRANRQLRGPGLLGNKTSNAQYEHTTALASTALDEFPSSVREGLSLTRKRVPQPNREGRHRNFRDVASNLPFKPIASGDPSFETS